MILNKTEVCLLVIGPTIPSSERCYFFFIFFFYDSLNTEKNQTPHMCLQLIWCFVFIQKQYQICTSAWIKNKTCTASHLSKFGSGLFLFHSAVGYEVIKHLTCKPRRGTTVTIIKETDSQIGKLHKTKKLAFVRLL